jgi:hypothetical protein
LFICHGKLTSACYKELLQKGVQSICSVAWKQDGHVRIGGILKALGLKGVKKGIF